jgi:2-polyprenyl-3-methyl-5-hydroxy-6-metoxy-1,4-benzoquinol methylase
MNSRNLKNKYPHPPLGSFNKKLEIFKLNSYKPFAHGVWQNKNKYVGDEESLEGRNELIISEFKKIILKKYKINEIKKMTILDVGSYDGHTSIYIEKILPFKKIVSLEPRKKNILKGEFVRNYLKIKTNVKFVNGTIDNIKERFDIVFCVGVLHHLDDISTFIKKITKIAKRSIYLENLSYNPKNNLINFLLNKINIKIVEPKDIIYKFKNKNVGICAYKYETNYYDGSTIDNLSVVSLPNTTYLEQLLFVNNFKSEILLDGKDYFKNIKKKFRNFSSSIIYAEKTLENNAFSLIKNITYQYEYNYLNTYLSPKLLSLISKYKILYKPYLYLINKNNFKKEIILNFKYNFEDKTNLEKAKIFLKDKKIFRSTRCLFKIIGKLNADYRSCYRAFALLSFIYKKKDKEKSKFFANLLLNCNPKYPLKINEIHSSQIS